MNSLAYSHSTPIADDGKGCEICLPKKGHAHHGQTNTARKAALTNYPHHLLTRSLLL